MKVEPDFVATNFTFYDCSSYSSCTQCVSSSFPCDWCVSGHRCTHDTGQNCRNDILVTGISSVGPSIRSGPGFCPRIIATAGRTTEVLVPSGISKRILIKVDNIPQFIVSTRFVCQFNIEGRVKQVNAQLLGDTIYCDGLQFTLDTNHTNITADFHVIWNASKPLDNPENIHILVYRCQRMAPNCGFCLELPDKYSCGWCQETDSCQVQKQCGQHNTMWLNRQQTCPDPKIIDFYPKSGPWESGTNITIEGINLGRTFQDISTGVGISHELNGAPFGIVTCSPYREDYVKTVRIKCIVQSPRNMTTANQAQLGSISGPVIVKVLNEYTAKSKENYKFVNPKILTISPSKGPISGGTKLTIEGLHMDAGSKAEAFLGSLPCDITRRTINYIECITSARHMPGEEKVRVKFDNGQTFFDYYNYLYVGDPKIFSVESGSGGYRGEASGIPSGGISISVKGEHLNIIQKPLMYVEVNGEVFSNNCTSISAVQMKCESPSVPIEKLDYPEYKEYVELDYGFIMDNVKSVMNMSNRKSNPFSKFRMYRNPHFTPFTEENGIKLFRCEYLVINIRNLEMVQESDVTVCIGSSTCNVTSLSKTQLNCRPNTSQPSSKGNVVHDVIVGIAGKLNFTIGKLRYDF